MANTDEVNETPDGAAAAVAKEGVAVSDAKIAVTAAAVEAAAAVEDAAQSEDAEEAPGVGLVEDVGKLPVGTEFIAFAELDRDPPPGKLLLVVLSHSGAFLSDEY